MAYGSILGQTYGYNNSFKTKLIQNYIITPDIGDLQIPLINLDQYKTYFLEIVASEDINSTAYAAISQYTGVTGIRYVNTLNFTNGSITHNTGVQYSFIGNYFNTLKYYLIDFTFAIYDTKRYCIMNGTNASEATWLSYQDNNNLPNIFNILISPRNFTQGVITVNIYESNN